MCNRTITALAFLLGLSLGYRPLSSAQEKNDTKTEYVFRPEKRRVLLDRFPYYYEGYLHLSGAFIPDPKASPIECNVAIEQRSAWIRALEKRKFPIYNKVAALTPEPSVYQFLPGDQLILGALVEGSDGFSGGIAFGPLVENNRIKVVSMAQYLKNYDPERHIRIYNLPGRIVKKGEADKETK